MQKTAQGCEVLERYCITDTDTFRCRTRAVDHLAGARCRMRALDRTDAPGRRHALDRTGALGRTDAPGRLHEPDRTDAPGRTDARA